MSQDFIAGETEEEAENALKWHRQFIDADELMERIEKLTVSRYAGLVNWNQVIRKTFEIIKDMKEGK